MSAMASPRHHRVLLILGATALAVVSATAVELSSFHELLATDDESCCCSPEECPVVYDLDADDAAGVGRRRLQYYYEVNTAALPTAQYISYGALMRDSVPCSLPGASYYNCQPGAEANPYTRGCSAIAQCRE